MAAPLGNKFATGRPKGVPNKATKAFRDILGTALDEMVGTIPELIAQIEDPKDRIDAIAKLMPYAYPKLQTITVSGDSDEKYQMQPPNVTYERTDFSGGKTPIDDKAI